MKNIDINCFGNLRDNDTIQIVINGEVNDYNPKEILRVIDKLGEIQHYLVENLVFNDIKKEK